MPIDSFHWCRSIPPAEQRSTPPIEHQFPPPSKQQSTQPAESLGARQTASINICYPDHDCYYKTSPVSCPRLPIIDRHRLYVDWYPSQTRPTVDWNQQPNYGRQPPEYDAWEPLIFKETTDGHVPIGKRRRDKIPKHLRRDCSIFSLRTSKTISLGELIYYGFDHFFMS